MSEDIESAQKNQKKIGAAEDDPETSGPAENLREEAAEMTDKEQDEKEPVSLDVCQSYKACKSKSVNSYYENGFKRCVECTRFLELG